MDRPRYRLSSSCVKGCEKWICGNRIHVINWNCKSFTETRLIFKNWKPLIPVLRCSNFRTAVERFHFPFSNSARISVFILLHTCLGFAQNLSKSMQGMKIPRAQTTPTYLSRAPDLPPNRIASQNSQPSYT